MRGQESQTDPHGMQASPAAFGRARSGGEIILVTLAADGEGTRVTIATNGGINGNPPAKNWSTPIYQQLLNRLNHPSAAATPPA